VGAAREGLLILLYTECNGPMMGERTVSIRYRHTDSKAETVGAIYSPQPATVKWFKEGKLPYIDMYGLGSTPCHMQ